MSGTTAFCIARAQSHSPRAGPLDTASMPEELVKLVVGVMGYAAEMELKSIKKRTAETTVYIENRNVFGFITTDDLPDVPASKKAS